MADDWDAVVLAGGKGGRLGGVTKSDLEIGGRQLLDRALDAVASASAVVVVGGPRREGVRWTVEDPPGGGPAAGLLAGLRALRDAREASAWTLVLAVDTPGASAAVPALLSARARDGAWLVDTEGRPQPLLAVYRTAALPSREDAHAAPMRSLVSGLEMVALPDSGEASHDVDTWEDVEYWKGRLT